MFCILMTYAAIHENYLYKIVNFKQNCRIARIVLQLKGANVLKGKWVRLINECDPFLLTGNFCG